MFRKHSLSVPTTPFWPTFPTGQEPAQPRPARDDTRRHALNWFLGVSGLAGAGILALWWVLYRFGWANLSGLGTALPLALVGGMTAASWQLIKYTREYRDWLYARAAEAPAGNPRKELLPPKATQLRGPDGVFRPVEVDLSTAEIAQLKGLLLREGGCSVRSLTPLVGDRASLLRQELHRLGILAELRQRAATPLTPGGKQAVERW